MEMECNCNYLNNNNIRKEYCNCLLFLNYLVMLQKNYFSMYAREHIQQLFLQRATIPGVMEILSNEGIETCRQFVWRLQRHKCLSKY